jgi:hypothetical protein
MEVGSASTTGHSDFGVKIMFLTRVISNAEKSGAAGTDGLCMAIVP